MGTVLLTQCAEEPFFGTVCLLSLTEVLKCILGRGPDVPTAVSVLVNPVVSCCFLRCWCNIWKAHLLYECKVLQYLAVCMCLALC